MSSRSGFLRDVAGSTLYQSSGFGLLSLIGFIAAKRLNASVTWVGLIGSSAYWGYLWNLFFSSITAKLSLKNSIVVIMLLSGLVLTGAAFQKTVVSYSLCAITFLVILGLFDVQYNTLIKHLYAPDIRPRWLSRRFLAISLASALFGVLYGRISAGKHGHMPAFLIAAVMMIGGAALFSTISTPGRKKMEPFRPWSIIQTVFRDQRFVRVAVILTVYGWVGAGANILLIFLYKQSGFDETLVGILRAVTTAGMIFATLVITPRLRFRGGITNFRLCYSGSALAMVIYGLVAFGLVENLSFWVMALGNFIFGIAGAGFQLAIQTTALNLSPSDKTTLYVNAIMIIQGSRGMLAPILVAAVFSSVGMEISFVIMLCVSFFCAAVVFVPGIDGKARLPAPSDPD